MSKTVQIPINLIDNTILNIQTEKSTTGLQLITLICNELNGNSINNNIQEDQLFGLQFYKIKKQELVWLQNHKKVWDQLKIKKGVSIELIPQCHFLLKYYPEDVTKDIDPFSFTLKYLYLQVQNMIQTKLLDCKIDIKQELGRIETNCSVKNIRGIVNTRNSRTSFNESMSFNNGPLNHNQINVVGAGDINAMLAYLEIAQRLPTYGISFWDVKDKTGAQIILGINATGISIHNVEDRIQILSKFDWSSIRTIEFNDRKLILKMVNTTEPTIVYFTQDLRKSEAFIKFGMAYHKLYMDKHNNINM